MAGPKQKSDTRVKVYAFRCVCDSVAKPMVQNFKQVNGSNGCSFCLHSGEPLKKGSGMTQVYPCTDQVPERREHKTTVELGETALKEGEVLLGVKGPSVCTHLPFFHDGFTCTVYFGVFADKWLVCGLTPKTIE